MTKRISYIEAIHALHPTGLIVMRASHKKDLTEAEYNSRFKEIISTNGGRYNDESVFSTDPKDFKVTYTAAKSKYDELIGKGSDPETLTDLQQVLATVPETNIQSKTPIQNSINRIKSLNSYTVTLKTDSIIKDSLIEDDVKTVIGREETNLIPTLTEALKESIQKIELLEAKVAALEAK